MAVIGVFMVAVALVMGMVGCGNGVVIKYDLNITSTTGGHVTSPGEGTFSYNEGTVVNLIAKAEWGYQFLNWSGDVDTIGDVDDPETIITANADYDITANFGTCMVASGYDHVVGLETDGTVVAEGDNSVGQCDVFTWTDIVQIAAGMDHTVGLESDGTAVAVGDST